MRALLVIALAAGCATDEVEPPVVVCGTPGEQWLANAHENQDCTHFLGSIHVSDSPGEPGLEWLPPIRVVDGSLTFFRNDGATSMRGLDRLEHVGGTFGISHHAKLSSLDGLDRLRFVGGDFYAYFNRTLHDNALFALAARIEIGGTLQIRDNATR